MNWVETVAKSSPNKLTVFFRIWFSHVFLFVVYKRTCLFSRHFLRYFVSLQPHNLLFSTDHTWAIAWFSFLCLTLEFFWWLQYWHSCLFCRKHIFHSASCLFVYLAHMRIHFFSVLILCFILGFLFYSITNNTLKVQIF